jgi:hypothetical protein
VVSSYFVMAAKIGKKDRHRAKQKRGSFRHGVDRNKG